MSKNILEIKNLNKHFVSSYGINRAINDVSFNLEKGEIMGLIGQSGSGKTTIGKALMRTLSETKGIITLDGKIYPNIAKSNKKALPYKKKVQMIYQNPMDSLNGLRNIYSTLEEALLTHKIIDKNFKQLVASQDEIMKVYGTDFELNASELELNYFIDKAKLIEKHNKKFKNSTSTRDLKNYIFFEEERLNKDIINLLTKLEDNYTEFYNKKYADFVGQITDSKEAKKLIKVRNELAVINNAKDDIAKHEENLKNFDKSIVIKTKDIRHDSEITIKSLVKTQKSMYKSYKEISATQNDFFTSFVYKKEELLSRKTYALYKEALKEMKKKAFTAKKIHEFTEDIDAEFKKFKIEINNKYTKEDLVNDFKGTLSKVKDEIANEPFNINKYLSDQKCYEDQAKTELAPELEKINKKYNDAKKVKYSDKLITDLEKKIESATIEVEKINKAKKEKNDALIEERLAKRDEIEVQIKALSKELEDNSKEAMKIFNEKTQESMNEKRDQLKSIESKAKQKELHIKIKGTKKATGDLIRNYKVKNGAYEVEKKVITKNIKKIRIISGLEKQPILFKNKQYKQVIITRKIYSILKKVGLKPEHAYRYPHEFSGGQLQRILVARALLVEPDVIIADEPIASLDISIQAQVINLLLGLVRERNISMIFIGHDLSTIEYLCDSLLVLHLGRVVEKGTTKEIFKRPIHPYTEVLFKSIPKISEANKKFELFSDVNGYLREWTQTDGPSFHKVNENHLVYANSAQWKAWNVKKKRK